MSVGDGNSVDRTGGAYPTMGNPHGSDPALAAEFQASRQLARQNMTAGQRYALNSLPWPSNQTATDASPRQPSPQTNKVPSPTNTPDSGRRTVSPFGWLLTQIDLAGAAFQQLGRMQHMIENAPVTTFNGKRFDPDATQKEMMKRFGLTNQQELNELIRNASDDGREPAATDPTKKTTPEPAPGPHLAQARTPHLAPSRPINASRRAKSRPRRRIS
jgi:hypothetical protein